MQFITAKCHWNNVKFIWQGLAVFRRPQNNASKLLLKPLRKQDDFRWKRFINKITFVEALRKPFKKRINRDNTKVSQQKRIFGVLPLVEDPALSRTTGCTVPTSATLFGGRYFERIFLKKKENGKIVVADRMWTTCWPFIQSSPDSPPKEDQAIIIDIFIIIQKFEGTLWCCLP